jgi:hypothetical protein
MAQWSVLSQAHNTVLVDDAGQCRWRGDRGEWYSHVPLKNRWSTGPDWDVVEADFDGPFERDIGPVRIWRRVAFHKGAPPFWWITDRVEGSGEHDVAALFHFAHDIAEVGGIPGGVRTRVPGGPDLAIVANGGETVVRLFRGERDPVRGWMSPALGAAEPAWACCQCGGTISCSPGRRPCPRTCGSPGDAKAERLTWRSGLALSGSVSGCPSGSVPLGPAFPRAEEGRPVRGRYGEGR